MSVSRQIGSWISSFTWNDIPPATRHNIKRAIVDWYACAVAGSIVPVTAKLRASLVDELGTGPSALIPDGTRAPTRTAALINGTASHGVEFDDIYAPGLIHPGCPTIAAAHALGSARKTGGPDFMRSVLIGFEVGNRIARAINPAHYTHWHTTGTAGVFAAAAAASALFEHSPETAGHAIGTAATLASGLREGFGGDTKPLHAGRAAEGGVLAALSAGGGFLAPDHMLEGPAGFGHAVSGNVDWDTAFAGLGADFTIDSITVKIHGCCGHAFAALDGLRNLQQAHGFDAEAVAEIDIATYAKGVEILANPRPVSENEGRFSLPFCAATVLIHGAVGLASFDEARLNDRHLLCLAGKVRLSLDQGSEAAFPARRGAKVTVRLKSGKSHDCHVPDRYGSPEVPISDAQIGDKFMALTRNILEADAAVECLRRLWALETESDVSAVI